jgi:SAM-dependent methyltransferase
MSGTSPTPMSDAMERGPGTASAGERPRGLEFLIVDEFLRSFVEARTLKTAFELGLIDRLVEHGSGSVNALAPVLGVDRPGLRFLLDLLTAGGVVQESRGDVRLTRRFQTALRYRDLLEVKLDYAGFTINDFADLFTTLIRDGGGFMGKARLFELFDYRRALTPTIENYMRTRIWMRITSTLTHYEAGPCLDAYDASQHRRMLDIGGNSGEFALQFCRRHPTLRASVFDLPLVCELGLDHVLAHPEHARMSFISGDLRAEPVPAGYDLITFKSMLHDWPAADARQFIDKAARALAPGGTLLIFERGALQTAGQTPPMSMLPNLLFFRSYRPAIEYMDQLNALGFLDVRWQDIELDSRFHVITGRKPAA